MSWQFECHLHPGCEMRNLYNKSEISRGKRIWPARGPAINVTGCERWYIGTGCRYVECCWAFYWQWFSNFQLVLSGEPDTCQQNIFPPSNVFSELFWRSRGTRSRQSRLVSWLIVHLPRHCIGPLQSLPWKNKPQNGLKSCEKAFSILVMSDDYNGVKY